MLPFIFAIIEKLLMITFDQYRQLIDLIDLL